MLDTRPVGSEEEGQMHSFVVCKIHEYLNISKSMKPRG